MPLACFQCVDTLPFASKHAEGMSLRYGVERLPLLPTNNSLCSSGVFRRETASGFYPWGKVEGPRKRVAEGLCGWRHGNSFPMTQSTQSLCQMRSIPLCSKAVFYVFVFDSIHDSATLHNLCPNKYPLNRFFSNPPTPFLKCHRRWL